MVKKIKENVERHIKWYNEGHATYEELKENYLELMDLVYRMWQQDLISDKTKEACDLELSAYLSNIIKLHMAQATV